MRLAPLALLAALVTLPAVAHAQVKQTVEQEGALRYLRYLPKGHESKYRWPVLVFLHGGGEIGSDITKLLGHSLPALVEQESWDWPFIVVSPQLDSGKWFERATDIGVLLDRLEADYGGDSNRLYLTGLSWGGIGTFDVGTLLSERWAALMPLCSNSANGAPWDERQKIADKPMFVVHGTADAGVPFQGDVDRVAQLTALGASFFEFEYALSDTDNDAITRDVLAHDQVFGRFIGYDHGVWNPVYGRVGGPKKTVQYEWLLAHSLNGSPFVDPKLAPPIDPNVGGSGGSGGSGAGSGGALAVGGSSITESGGTGSSGAPALAPQMPSPMEPLPTTNAQAESSDSDASCQLSHQPRPGHAWPFALLGLLLLGRRRTAS